VPVQFLTKVAAECVKGQIYSKAHSKHGSMKLK